MKNLLLIFAIAIPFIFISCNDETFVDNEVNTEETTEEVYFEEEISEEISKAFTMGGGNVYNISITPVSNGNQAYVVVGYGTFAINGLQKRITFSLQLNANGQLIGGGISRGFNKYNVVGSGLSAPACYKKIKGICVSAGTCNANDILLNIMDTNALGTVSDMLAKVGPIGSSARIAFR